jgi:hypothetical protein
MSPTNIPTAKPTSTKFEKRPNKREPERMHQRHIIIVAKQYARQLKPASAQTLGRI